MTAAAKPSRSVIRAQARRLAYLRGLLVTETRASARRELGLQVALICVRYPAARD